MNLDQALASFSNVMKNLDPASTDDIEAYRTWMERHAPIEHAETRFLERRHDLVAVSARRSANNVGGAGRNQSVAVCLPLILVLPLMAFAMIPGLVGRLFIIALVGSAGVAVVTSTELMGLMTVREWIGCASM